MPGSTSLPTRDRAPWADLDREKKETRVTNLVDRPPKPINKIRGKLSTDGQERKNPGGDLIKAV